METSQNQRIFNFLSSLNNPKYETKKILKVIVLLHWDSIRKFAQSIGYTHTAINKVVSGKSKSSEVAEVMFAFLDIENPWL